MPGKHFQGLLQTCTKERAQGSPHTEQSKKTSPAAPCWSLLGGLAPAQTPLPFPQGAGATGPSPDTH